MCIRDRPMTVPKVFKTIEDQIKILRSRGLRVDSRHKTILLHENYYNIINGYKKPFLASCGPNETYLRGTSFKEIIALYEFDRSLRYITLRRLLKMETHIKSVVAYVFSKYHGYDHKLYPVSYTHLGAAWNKGHTWRRVLEVGLCNADVPQCCG